IFITLKNAFIDKYKNKATIDATFTVDVVGQQHKQKEDGEVHVAGRAPEVELPVVAELTNARAFPNVKQKLQDAEGGVPLAVSGAWRVWCEHAGAGVQKQGQPLQPFTTS